MTSASFWEYHKKSRPFIGVNLACTAIYFLTPPFLIGCYAFNALGAFWVHGCYWALTSFYLFTYWFLDKNGFSWNTALKTIHLLGSIGLGTLIYVAANRLIIHYCAQVPRRYYYFPTIWSEISRWIDSQLEIILLTLILGFLFLQVLFFFNLVYTLIKGINSH